MYSYFPKKNFFMHCFEWEMSFTHKLGISKSNWFRLSRRFVFVWRKTSWNMDIYIVHNVHNIITTVNLTVQRISTKLTKKKWNIKIVWSYSNRTRHIKMQCIKKVNYHVFFFFFFFSSLKVLHSYSLERLWWICPTGQLLSIVAVTQFGAVWVGHGWIGIKSELERFAERLRCCVAHSRSGTMKETVLESGVSCAWRHS